jgi:hypothetical protein
MSITNEAKTDLEAVCLALAEKRPVDPEVVKRARERSEQLHRESGRKFAQELSVELLREVRDE